MAMWVNPFTGKIEWRINGHNYLYLPGRVGGQEVWAGTQAGNNLKLHSNIEEDGKIYLGNSSYFDEDLDKLRIGGHYNDGYNYDLEVYRSSGMAWSMIRTTDTASYAQQKVFAGSNGITLAAFGAAYAGGGSGTNDAYMASNVSFQSSAPSFTITNEQSGGLIQFYVGGFLAAKNVATISSTGLAIGANIRTPLAPLHLANSSVPMTFGVQNVANILGNAYYSDGYKRINNSAAPTALFFNPNSYGVGDIGFYNAATGAADSVISWTNRLMILASGYTGIGIAVPERILHTRDAINAFRMDRGDGTVPSVLLVDYSNTTYNTINQVWGFGGLGTDDFNISNLGNRTAGTGALKFTIANDTGYVGLSTSTPGQRLDIGYGNLRFTKHASAGACTAALAGVAGNVDNGTHSYKFTYTTAGGETDLIEATASNTVTVTDKTVDGRISLTGITASTNPAIVNIKIYRTKAGGALYYYLATIANGTTTYTDNTADSGLAATDSNSIGNTTAGYVYVNTYKSGLVSNSNTFWGYNSLSSVTTGYFNVGLGYNIMNNLTTGYRNFGGGYQSLNGMISGYNNVAIGFQSMYTSTNGYNCVALGYLSLYSDTSGYANFALGSNSLQYNQGGYENIAVGVQALQYNVSGLRSVGIGTAALQANLGTGNTGIGYQAGLVNKTGTYNLYLGYLAGATGVNNLTKSIAIGYNSRVDASNTMALGGTGADAVKVVIGGTTANATLDVRGSFATAVAIKTGDYTLTANDHTVKFTANATATLPKATGTGIIYTIVAEATVIVDADGSETIDEELTQTLIDGESIQIQDISTGVWNVL